QGELGLAAACFGQAGGVDLGKAGVGKEGPFLKAAPGGRAVGVDRVGGKVVDRGVAACRKAHGVAGVGFDLAGDEVAANDASRPSVDDDEVEHFPAGVELDPAGRNLPHQGAVGPEQELL